MPTILGTVQQKGGVAKTTNTINLSGAAATRGYNVLAVDADPQGYLTNRLGLEDAYRADEPNLYTAFNEPTDVDPNELIESHAEFDVLPSNIDLFRLEQDLIASGWKPRQRLNEVLERIEGYDLILIDAPPSLGPINDNVLLSVDGILIPCEADDSSILALEHLFNQIDTLEDRYDTRIDEKGILVSNVNYPLDNEQQGMLEWYEDTFEGRCPVHIIRHRAAIKRAMNDNGSIFGEGAEETDMESVYLEIVDSLGVGR